ncbi:hypothetical protein OXX59_004800 [Metschnikowia pulcherrima]
MSSFDLTRIAESLSSTKTKSRNDALALLDGFQCAKLRLSSQQLAILITSLLKAIEIERDAFAKNNANPALTRATSAAGFMKELIEESVRKSARERPKSKTCSNLISSIVSLYYLPSSYQPFAAVAAHFVRILGSLLETPYIFTHFSAENWSKSYHFLLQATARELDVSDGSVPNENLLSDLYDAIYSIIGGPQTYGLVPLLKDREYFPMLHILTKPLALFNKRETPVLVTAFKIINNLLISLSTEDSSFSHQLIRAGIESAVRFASSSVTALSEQIFVFLNLDPMHRYLSLAKIPKLISASPENDNTALNSDDSVMTYNLEMLIYALLQRLMSSSSSIGPEDVGLRECEEILDWYHLCHMGLKSDNRISWLLASALSRLVSSYYRIHEATQSSSSSLLAKDNEIDESVSGRSFSTNSYKRQKIGERQVNLHRASTPAQHYNNMISGDDPRLQKCGLQLLAFHLEYHYSEILLLKESETVTGSKDGLESIGSVTDAQNDASLTMMLIANTIRLLADKTQNFWALLVCRQMLSSSLFETVSSNMASPEKLYQMSKLSLDLIKDASMSSLACDTFGKIVMSRSQADLKVFIDSTMLNQLENVAEFSELLGPTGVDKPAFAFWRALAKTFVVIGSRKRSTLSHHIARWLIEKWSSLFARQTEIHWKEVAVTTLSIIAWLGGFEYSEIDIDNVSPDFRYKSMKTCKKLQKFIVLEDDIGQKKSHSEPQRFKTESSIASVNAIADFIIKGSLISVSEDNLDFAIHLSMVCAKISKGIRGHLPEISSSLEEAARNIMSSLTPIIRSREQAHTMLSVLQQFDIPEDILHEVAFPFEILHYQFQYLPKTSSGLVDLTTDFDAEFLNGNEIRSSTPGSDHPYNPCVENISYFRFLARYDPQPSTCIRYMASLPNECILDCVSFYLDSDSFKSQDRELNAAVGLIRVVGERLLSVQDFDRLDSTIVISTMLLEALMPLMQTRTNGELRNDSLDLIAYFFQCAEKNLLLSERARTCIWNMLLHFMKYNPESAFTNNEILASLTNQIPSFSNKARVEIAENLNSHFRTLDPFPQSFLFSKIADVLYSPQSSVETSATYCLFLTTLAGGLYLDTKLLGCMMPYCRFDFFRLYMERCVKDMASTNSTKSPTLYFKSMRLELLSNWWRTERNLSDFPYDVFGYASRNEYICDNSRHIVCVLFASACNEGHLAVRESFFKTVSEASSTNAISLIQDSVPILIAMSHASNGVGPEIFTFLKTSLGAQYTELVREMLPLIILEVINITNVKSEIDVRTAVQTSIHKRLLVSEEEIKMHLREMISPSQSVKLILSLIKTFWTGNVETFWSVQTVYFLIRHVGLSESVAEPQSNIILRRVQYILCLSHTQDLNFHLTRLLLEICLPIMESGILPELQAVLSMVDLDSCLLVSLELCLPIILKLLAIMLLAPKDQRDGLHEVGEKLERLIFTAGDRLGSSRRILDAALKQFANESFEVTLEDVGQFLDDDKIADVISHSLNDVFTIFSCILTRSAISSKNARSQSLAAMFINHFKSCHSSDEFSLWVAEYLAEFHLTGDAHNSLEDILSKREYTGLDKRTVDAAYKTLNPFLNVITETIQSVTYEERAYLESAIGAMMFKFTNKRRDVAKYLDFDETDKKFGSYLLRLDPRLCEILYSNKSKAPLPIHSVEYITKNFGTILVNNSFQEWTCQLLLSFIHEISRMTSVAAILADCISRLPGMAKDVMPSFICFYLFVGGDRGVSNILRLFDEYWKNFKRPICQESIDLFKNIAITLRVGAMQNIEQLKHLYSALDHRHLFLIVRESVSPKSALMFFEDSIAGKLESLNWAEDRESLAHLYGSVNDEDSLSGIPAGVTIENILKLRQDFIPLAEKLRYESGLLDAAYISGVPLQTSNIIDSLSAEGYLGVANQLNQVSKAEPSSEWSWKLNQWDLPTDETSADAHDVTYSYFKHVRDNPINAANAYRESMSRLVGGMPQGSVRPREHTIMNEKWLESLGLIKCVDSIFTSDSSSFSTEIAGFESKTIWFETADSRYFENILSARRLAFSLHSERQSSHSHIATMGISSNLSSLCQQGEVFELMRYNRLARKENMLQKTIASSILLEKLVSQLDTENAQTRQELQRLSSYQIAHTLWAEGKTDMSVALMRDLSTRGDIILPLANLNVSQMTIKAQLAIWLAESRSDLGSNILECVVEPMKPEIDSVSDARQRWRIYHLLAEFCESQFKSSVLKEQISQLEKRLAARKEEAQEIKSHYGESEVSVKEKNAARLYYIELKSLIKSETSELVSLGSLRSKFAHNSVRFYLSALLSGQASDEDLDKFFSLFLELSGDSALQSSIKHDLLELPSRMPLAWCTQILSRVSKDASRFQESIQKLLFKIFHDHPYHSLYYLMSLLHHEKLAKDTANVSMLSRVVAATHIRDKLLGAGSLYAKKYLLPIERLCTECVSLAEMKSARGRTLSLDKLKIGAYWMNELPTIPPPTLGIPVSNSGYANVPSMLTMDSKVSIASSGISLPKVVTFSLTDGRKHKMLLKHGTDDLRQDAIMEQVFEKVNKIFHEDKETRKRKLRVRTYSAVPLGPTAGVIEFVPDTKAFFEVIQPYHVAMDGMRIEKARELMRSNQAKETSDRLKVYQSIENKIKPVLRHFFLNNFVTPDKWFASRQIYIRGVATTSIVGYMLGLGDRHCNNILLDEFTGEPIHIDLGVAFDQGKRLKVPETVPFRLTRDVVDGFGYMGTSGSFSKVSEHTFRVLRGSKDHILAILDALRWDPLYSWSISPLRNKKLQGANKDALGLEAKQDGSAASKAIFGVSDKLSAGGLSVEATVRELIREATSEQNLAVIYSGWSPFY